MNDTKTKKKERSASKEIKYFSKKISLNDLIKAEKSNGRSYIKLSLKSDMNESLLFNLVLSIVHLREYSLIKQIFSSSSNSKIFSLPLNHEQNKFELIIYKCINEIESRSLVDPFIYELETCQTDIKWALLQIERDFLTIIQHLPDVNSVASKLFYLYI